MACPRVLSLARALLVMAGCCVASAIVIANVVRADLVTEAEEDRDGLQMLAAYRKTERGAERLANGSIAFAHDVVQLQYASAKRHYGVVLSVDGAGGVTLHFPAAVDDSTALGPRIEATLPRAFELDEAPRFERFFFVTSDQPLDVERILCAGYALGARPHAAEGEWLDLAPQWMQSAFTLQKGTGPRPLDGAPHAREY